VRCAPREDAEWKEIIFGIGITALAGALANRSRALRRILESDIGSQGDPNSQVQLAPQNWDIFTASFNKGDCR